MKHIHFSTLNLFYYEDKILTSHKTFIFMSRINTYIHSYFNHVPNFCNIRITFSLCEEGARSRSPGIVRISVFCVNTLLPANPNTIQTHFHACHANPKSLQVFFLLLSFGSLLGLPIVNFPASICTNSIFLHLVQKSLTKM